MYSLGIHLQKITSINQGDSHSVKNFGLFELNDNEEFDVIVEDREQASIKAKS